MPEIIKAFVARSFAESDVERLKPLINFLETFEPLGLFCYSAEPAEAEQVSAKVQRLIGDCSVFIGMFTRKYPIIDGASTQVMVRSEYTRWTAPSWVLQESGYALGIEKKLLFFVEEGVELPELAGDLEYIPYDFAKPAAAFKRVNEALGKIIRQNLALDVSPAIRHTTQTTPPEPTQEEEKKPEERGLFTYLEAIWAALKKRDKVAAQKAFEDGLKHIQQVKKGNELLWKIIYHQDCVGSGYPEAMMELYSLESEFPDDPAPTAAIAQSLRQFKDFPAAAKAFQKAAGKKPNHENFAQYITSAAECLQQAGNAIEARGILLKALDGASSKSKMEIMAKLYENLKLSKDWYQAFAVAEHSLQRNGAQTDLHFRLAYDYSENHLNDLAAYHYESVLAQREDSTATNNLAVAFWDLELPIKAVVLYKEAFKSGNTLAGGNLAYRYLNAGMAEEARSVIKIQDPSSMVTEALAEITRRKDDEVTKRQTLLDEGDSKREFLAQMGEAILGQETAHVSAKWSFPEIVMELKVEGKIVKGRATREVKSGGLSALFGGSGQGASAAVDIFTFKGSLDGRVCHFTISEEQSDGSGYINYAGRKSRSGYVVFDTLGKTARILEVEPQMKTYEITAVDD
jgi:tetratricopeptide (TPR) repeat protein